jgi:glyoxylase I family protein
MDSHMNTIGIDLIAAPEKRAQLQAARDARRSRNSIRRLHHHALRTNDMEATRHFYEDIVGMPMVLTTQGDIDPTAGRRTPFLHCFFELGDGSSLAFFEFLPEAREPAPKPPQDGADHHIAVFMPEFDALVRLKSKLDRLGHATCGIDHGFCYSLYVRDPNDMLVEFVGEPANELELGERATTLAHDAFAKWNRKDYAQDSVDHLPVNYPLPTSPLEDMMKVLPADR